MYNLINFKDTCYAIILIDNLNFTISGRKWSLKKLWVKQHFSQIS